MTDLMLRPDDTGEIQLCQVADPSIDLTCDAREGGGYRCEVDGPHDNHRISDHTIRHAREGNGYACSAFDEDRTTVIRPIPPVPPTADLDSVTTRLKPPTVLVPIVPRRPPLNPNQAGGLVEAPAFMPTGAELAVHARGCRTVVPNDEDFTTAPAAPTRPLPPPPPAPKPADDQGAVAWMWVDGKLRFIGQPTQRGGRHRRPTLLARLIWKRGGAR